MDNVAQGGEAAALLLLRQLSIGLGVYRLYPGDPTWPLFASSVERVRESALVALALGPVEVEIRGRAVRTRDGPLPDDDLLGRLALACYERAAERLVVRDPPDAADLSLLYRVLTLPIEEVELFGGAGALLRASGISSVVLGELGPPASASADGRVASFPREQLELWDRLRDPAALAALLLSGGGGQGQTANPAEVLREMESLASMLPEEVSGQVNLYDRLQEVISQLPADLRRKLLAYLIEQLKEHRLAQRLVGIMSNAELARALVDLGRDGHDPMELARSLAEGPGGRAHLSDLTAALMQGHEEAGTILAGIDNVGGLDEGVWERSASVLETVSDLLARDLKSTESEDLRSLQEEFSRYEGSARLHGSMLADYFLLEANLGRLREVMSVWTVEARDAFRRLDGRRLDELLSPVETARARTDDPERLKVLNSSSRQVIDAALARALSDPGAEEDVIRELLTRFGPDAVEGLFDLLEEEPDRAVRTRLLGLLRSLPPAHQARLASRLEDHRWYVVRNAIHILLRSSGPEAMPLMAQAAAHSAPAVRREAIQGLVAVGGDEAIPVVLRLALGDPEESVRAAAVVALGGLLPPDAVEALTAVVQHGSTIRLRRLALEQIASHPAPEAFGALRHLGSRRSRPRLPRTLRAQARTAAKKRGGSR